MKSQDLTVTQKEFIKNNSLKMSINDMVIKLGVSFSKIQTFMNKNGLKPTKKQVQEIRIAKMKRTPKAKPKSLKKDWYIDAYFSA